MWGFESLRPHDMAPPQFVLLAAAFNLFGTSTYVMATLAGRTRPNRVTWLLWAVAPLVAFAAELSEGVGLRSIMTFMVGFGPLVVFLASLRNHELRWRITRLDMSCGAISIAALILWGITRTGTVAIALSILADLVAGIPTVAKAYRAPETEDHRAFLCAAISAGITLLTVTDWSFATVAFPVYILVFAGGLFVLVRFTQFRPAHVRASMADPATRA